MANVSSEVSFYAQIERIRVEFKDKVSRAHQLLQERETALLSELQQLEDSYRGEGELETNLETARDSIRRVELELDGNLEIILGMKESTRVRGVQDYTEKGRSVVVAGEDINTREQTSSEAKPRKLLSTNHDDDPSTYKDDHSLFPVVRKNLTDFSQQTDYMTLMGNCEKLLNGSTKSSEEFESIFSSPTALSYDGSNCPHQTTILSFTLSFLHIAKPPTNKRTLYSPNYTCRVSVKSINIWITKTGLHLGPNKLQQTAKFIVEGEPTRGLKNLGNTCYMNCILQCLSHTLPLRQFYVSNEYKQHLNNRGDLSCAFSCVMAELWSTTSDSVAPYDLKREVGSAAPMFSDYDQHDAHEFLRFLLNELHEEINRASVEGRKSPADNETLGEARARYLTWEDSRISEVFSGMLRSEVCCSICSNQSIVYIPFMDIALPIPENDQGVDLTRCLNMITTAESLIEEERPYCNICGDLTISTKQLTICNLPRFLVIQLKRFSYYPIRTKLSTPVKFDDTWHLKDSANNTHTYYLYGIVCHSGSLYGGHYIAYCYYNGIWKCLNDSMISIVNWEHVKHQEAYILFYVEK